MTGLLPLFPLGTVAFPGLLLPLQVFEPRYRTLMADLMNEPEPWSFGVIAIRQGHEVGTDSVKSLYDVGCAVVIQQAEQLPDGRLAVLLRGELRFTVLELDHSRVYLQADVEYVDEISSDVSDELVRTVRQRFIDYCAGLGATSASAALPDDATAMSYVVAGSTLLPLPERQALLETSDTAARLRAESELLSRELALLRTGTLPVTHPQLPPYSQN